MRSSASSVREEVEAGLRAVDHRYGDRLVQGDHRVWRDIREQLVQDDDLAPVRVLGAGRFVVDRGDRRLHLVRAERRAGQGVGDERRRPRG